MTYAIVAIGLIFLVEGLIWLFAPKLFVQILQQASPNDLRAYGAVVALGGLAILWFMT
jgi:uncharacterized protein YjeT (DUF2065 family)